MLIAIFTIDSNNTNNVPNCVTRLVVDSNIRQKACAAWNTHLPCYFTLANGVKQEGVISPIMFGMCIDLLQYHIHMPMTS